MAMNVNRTRRWGFILMFVGFAIGIPGILMLVAHDHYQATTRIKVIRSNADPEPPNGYDGGYDPYFIQTEFEIIKSDPILTNVIAKLHLDEEWARRYNYGRKLEMSEVTGLMRQSLVIQAVPNTMLIDISFVSEDPAEAASVANEIAAAYTDLRWKQQQVLHAQSVQGLKEQQGAEQEKVDALQTNIDLLAQEKDSPGLSLEDRAQKNRKFIEATNTLEHSKNFIKILEMKILSQSTYLGSTRVALISVIEPAKVPTSPLDTYNRPGKILLGLGLFLILTGIRLLWRAYFAAPIA